MVSNEKIGEFWKWFAEHCSELEPSRISDAGIKKFEEHLFTVHRLDWEIGPGKRLKNQLSLSPRGDRNLLELTRSIVAQAPHLENWEFFPAKLPRDWKLVFKLMVNGKEVEIDGKHWEFVTYRFADKTFDLLFKPDKPQRLTEDYLNWAATILADGELGEEFRMERIGQIEIVKSWDEKTAKAARKLEHGLLSKVMGEK